MSRFRGEHAGRGAGRRDARVHPVLARALALRHGQREDRDQVRRTPAGHHYNILYPLLYRYKCCMHLKEKYYGRNAASDTASVQKHFWGTLLQVTFPEWVNFMNTTITFEQNSDLGPAADARLDGGARLHPPGPRQGQPLPQLHRLVLIRRFRQVWEVDPLSSQCTCGEGSCSPRQVYIHIYIGQFLCSTTKTKSKYTSTQILEIFVRQKLHSSHGIRHL